MRTKNLGCVNCPLKGEECDTCIVSYRGSACAALRAKSGLEDDPKTNAEFLLEQCAQDVSKFAAYLCAEGWELKDMAECESWLLAPVEEDGELVHFFAGKPKEDAKASKPATKSKWKD